MKKNYDSPVLNFIAFEDGDILAAVSVVPGEGAVDYESWFGGWNLSGGSSQAASNDVKNILE